MINPIINTMRKAPLSRSMWEVFGKLAEEVGEVAEHLTKPTKEHDEPLESECCDVIMAATDLAWKRFCDDNRGKIHPAAMQSEFEKYMQKLMEKKLSKFLTKQNKRAHNMKEAVNA